MRLATRALALLLLAAALLVLQSCGDSAEVQEAKRLDTQAVRSYRAGRVAEATTLAKRSLAIKEKALGPEHPDVATSLNNLAVLYQAQGRYKDAGPLYRRALAIREKTLGPEHPNIVTTLNNMAKLYEKMGKKKEAAEFLERAEAMKKRLAVKK